MSFTPCTANTWAGCSSVDGGIGMAAVALNDGSVLLTGGCLSGDWRVGSSKAWLYRNGQLSMLSARMRCQRWGHTATLLKDGRVLIAGLGRVGDDDAQTAEVYDPVHQTFTPTRPMVQPRGWHAAARLTDGRVLLTGGEDRYGQASSSAEIFDPQTGSFSAAPWPMLRARAHHSATPVAGGCVLIVGDDQAELYAEANGRFVLNLKPMLTRRHRHAAVALPDGRVLVAGGYDSGWTHSGEEEIWSPDNTWRAVTNASASIGHRSCFAPTVTPLADGRVLMVGGAIMANPFQSSATFCDRAYLIDPVANRCSELPLSAGVARGFHVAAALPSGQVLLAGGAAYAPGVLLPTPALLYCPDPVPVELKLNFAGNGHGHVTSSPPGLDTSAASSAAFPVGSRVTLTAKTAATRIVPHKGPILLGRTSTPDFIVTHFDGWTGDATGTAATTAVTMAGAKTVTATFTESVGKVQPKPPFHLP